MKRPLSCNGRIGDCLHTLFAPGYYHSCIGAFFLVLSTDIASGGSLEEALNCPSVVPLAFIKVRQRFLHFTAIRFSLARQSCRCRRCHSSVLPFPKCSITHRHANFVAPNSLKKWLRNSLVLMAPRWRGFMPMLSAKAFWVMP